MDYYVKFKDTPQEMYANDFKIVLIPCLHIVHRGC